MTLVALHHWFRDHATAILTAEVTRSRRWDASVVALSVVTVLGFHLWIGLQTDFVPCRLDCGETYEVFIQARNLDRFGWRYAWGLQDMASNPERNAHPMLYTHNQNLTSLPYLLLLFKLGVREIHAQAVWFTLPFLLGLAYLYLAVKAVSHDGMLAGLCLLNAASLYLLVELWGFQAHRLWSWAVTWGMVYHLVQWSHPR